MAELPIGLLGRVLIDELEKLCAAPAASGSVAIWPKQAELTLPFVSSTPIGTIALGVEEGLPLADIRRLLSPLRSVVSPEWKDIARSRPETLGSLILRVRLSSSLSEPASRSNDEA